MQIIKIYTDGSSLGNPGNGGYGVTIIENQKVIKELGGFEEQTTNNRMELQAVIAALEFCNKNDNKNYEFVICTDSNYVLSGATIWIHGWEKNGWRTANKKEVLNQDLWKILISNLRKCKSKVTFQKVKGHSGEEFNERADFIATSFSSTQKCENMK